MIGHLCNFDHCQEKGCLDLKKNAFKKPDLTPLEQFNEEVMEEFKEKFTEFIPGDNGENGHDRQVEEWEFICEDPEEILSFITQKLTEHKALILKMVREKMRECLRDEHYRKQDALYRVGFQDAVQEFLNNLDTFI